MRIFKKCELSVDARPKDEFSVNPHYFHHHQSILEKQQNFKIKICLRVQYGEQRVGELY
jgi:hypothetical protein